MTASDETTVQLLQLKAFTDERGTLSLIDFESGQEKLPFNVQRTFWITRVPEDKIRGAHAHQRCWEALVAVSGQFTVKVDNGHGKVSTYRMSSPSQALVIPPLMWCELSAFSEGAACLCFASGSYEPEGYLHSHDEFARYIDDSARTE